MTHQISRRNVLRQAAATATTTTLASCMDGVGSIETDAAVTAPVADFSVSMTSGIAPLLVSFVDLSRGSVTTWAWTFGDGGTSSLQNPTQTYATPGAYTVTLTVVGPGGTHTVTRSEYVVVSHPTAMLLTLTGPGSGSVGRLSDLFTVGSDTPLSSPVVVTLDDGGEGGVFEPANVTLTATARTATFQYQAASAGTKRITLDNNGGLSNPSPFDFSAVVVLWPSSTPIGTWAAIPATSTLAALNPDNDPAVNPNYPGTAPWRSSGSHGAIVSAWCGAVPIPAQGRVVWVNPGGHNDGYPAASYDLLLDAEPPVFRRLCTPSGAVGRAAMDYAAEFARGNIAVDIADRHRAQHTENFQCFWPGVGIATLTGILLCNTGGGAAVVQPYVSDSSSGELSYGPGAQLTTSNVGTGGYAAACYDPVRNVAWHKGSGYDNQFGKWGGPSNDAWLESTAQPAIYIEGPTSLAYCPTLDLILVGNGGNDGAGTGPLNQNVRGGWGLFDPQTEIAYLPGLTPTAPTFTTAPDVHGEWPTGLCPGLCQPQWAPSLGAFLAWDNSAGETTQVMRITPPTSGDPRTGTWTIDYLPVAAGNSVTPSAAQANGTYGRFFVWDEAGICGVVNSVDETGYYFRYA